MSSNVVSPTAGDWISGAPWATSSFPDDVDTAPTELRALGAHVRRCNGLRGRMFALHCASESLLGFLAPRLVTTLVATALVLGIGALLS